MVFQHAIFTLFHVSSSISCVAGFVVPSRLRSVSPTLVSYKRLASNISISSKYSMEDISISEKSSNVANRALLISSFADGVVTNRFACDFIRDGLISKLANDALKSTEQHIAITAEQSPCCGPDLESVSLMERIDANLKSLHDGENTREATRNLLKITSEMNEEKTVQLRLLYIPTAMYAIRSSSSNTSGKQRQRARYDAKQKRKAVENFLLDIFNDVSKDINAHVLSVTLDLDDGTIKQPTCTPIGHHLQVEFPKDGKEALSSWSPHIIYVEGGNTFWLTHCLKKGEWENYIIEACRYVEVRAERSTLIIFLPIHAKLIYNELCTFLGEAMVLFSVEKVQEL